MRQENETFKSDVYSLAIIVWECLTRLEPFAEYEDPAEFASAVCEQSVRPPIPPGTPQSLANLLTAAWDDDPQQRPDAHTICLEFPGIIIDVTIEDRVGREFWRKHFSNEFAAPVDPFFSNFFSFTGYPQGIPNDPVLDYLTASLDPAQSDSVTAYEFAGFLRWFGPLHPDTSIITFMKSVFDKEWFWPDLSTKDASIYLSGQPDGTFLIRFSSQRNGSYTISWTRRQKILNSRITYVPSSGTYITPTGKSFASLDAWVVEAGVRQPLKEPGQISRFRQNFSQPVYEDLSAPLPQLRSVAAFSNDRLFQPARFRVVVDDDSATSSSSDSEE
jgi:serine/threonine protein kinase